MNALTSIEAEKKLHEFGPNKLNREAGPSCLLLLLRQFNSPLIWLLFGACALSVFLGDLTDSAAILAIIALNGFFGFYQEYRNRFYDRPTDLHILRPVYKPNLSAQYHFSTQLDSRTLPWTNSTLTY